MKRMLFGILVMVGIVMLTCDKSKGVCTYGRSCGNLSYCSNLH